MLLVALPFLFALTPSLAESECITCINVTWQVQDCDEVPFGSPYTGDTCHLHIVPCEDGSGEWCTWCNYSGQHCLHQALLPEVSPTGLVVPGQDVPTIRVAEYEVVRCSGAVAAVNSDHELQAEITI
jgi:hypothetical protein